MISLLYGLAIIVLYWSVVGIFLHGYYVHKYENLQEAEFHLDKDMKTWAPAVGAALVLILSETTLLTLTIIGVFFEAYMTYFDEQGSIGRFKRFIKGDGDE